jgi:hypothetical protein
LQVDRDAPELARPIADAPTALFLGRVAARRWHTATVQECHLRGFIPAAEFGGLRWMVVPERLDQQAELGGRGKQLKLPSPVDFVVAGPHPGMRVWRQDGVHSRIVAASSRAQPHYWMVYGAFAFQLFGFIAAVTRVQLSVLAMERCPGASTGLHLERPLFVAEAAT